MFEKVLIANRGEIALRVARACRELGIKSVASTRRPTPSRPSCASPTRRSTSGRPPPGKSYLHIPNIIGAAQKTGADAIHPGYGFLSEDPYFAEICSDNDITFIGPPPEVMEQRRRQGDRPRPHAARRGCRCCPGTIEPVGTAGRGAGDRRRDRLPGDHQGGRRRRRPRDERRARGARTSCASTRPRAPPPRRSSRTARVYIERYLEAPRHTEVQLVCDSHGNGVYFFERDCSVQRRHQKLIEEAPSIHLYDEARRDIGERAVNGRAVGRLHGRRDDGVPARRRRQPQLHGDERAHPGRAPGQRDDHQRRPDPGADPGGRRRAAVGLARTTSSSTATRSSAASTPRTPTATSRPPPAGSRSTCRPAARGRASTRTATRAGRSRPTTTR